MLKRAAIGSLLIFQCVIGASQCLGYFEPSPWTTEKSYNRKMFEKLKFGFLNASTAFFEIFEEPYQAVKENRMFWAGLGQGIFHAVFDTVGGALHIVTFYLTPLDIPLPEGGVDVARLTQNMQ